MVATRRHLEPSPDNNPLSDPRPRFAIGHVSITAADVDRLADFYRDIGFREVTRMSGIAILELRGGTHLVIVAGSAGGATLDLMVDDIGDTRALLADAGVEPGPVTDGYPHRVFTATDPEGNTLTINSSHVMGPV